MLYESTSKYQKRILWVAISLLIGVSVIVLALTLWMLYRSNFEQRVEGLRAMVREQASVIGSVARFDQRNSSDFSGGAKAATLSQIIEAYSSLGGFGETREFVLGHLRGDQIEFLSTFRFAESGAAKIVQPSTGRAAPMRRALSGEHGWMIGPDYRGERVLAAFQPIKELDLGLVAKLDMREVTAPFMKTAAAALGIAAVVVIIGGLLVLRMARPMLHRIEEIQKRFRTLLESAPDAMIIIDTSGEIVMVNRRTEELFGYSRDELTGQPVEMLMPQRFREHHPGQVRSFFTIPSARPMGSGLELFGCNKAGLEFPVEISLSPIETEDGTLVASSLRDITERKQAEIELAHSRKLMNAVLAHSPAVIYLKDLEGRYLMVNPVWCEVTGVSRERAIGATDFDFQSREVAEEFTTNDRQVAATGRPVQSEEHLPQSDGIMHTYMSYKFPVADEDGKVFAVGGVSSDITEIEQRERQYRVLVDTIPGTVYRCGLDEHWTMLFISDEVENLTGYPAADFLENTVRSFSSVIHPDDTAAVDKTIVTAIEKHQPYTIEYRVIRADGAIRHVYERGQAEFNDEGIAELLDGTVIDITEIKELQADLEKARQTADQANQAKSAFLANMSHELRTPMNAILGYSEMLMEEAEDVGLDDFIPDLKKINQAGNHLLALINDVLDLSKIESGKMEAYAETFDVGAFIDQVSGTAQPLMTKNSNHFKIERGENLGKAYQDLTKLRQSLLNLLSNAAKFTRDGAITLRAERKSQADGEWLTLSVSDTGIGITADKLDHVFEEFSQADNSTTRDYGGTGLGLPISRRFCQMLGGELTVTSRPGVGSTFTIRLPAVLPGAEVPPEETLQPTAGKVHAAGDVDEARPGSTILVIDDDAESCEIIGRFLKKDDFNVVTARSGEEGLRLAHKLKPAVITLDVMMPDMDGWSVLRVLKADPVLQEIPVVMLTMLDDKSKGYSLGATDYLTKPVDREQLHKALARYYQPGVGPRSILLVEDDPASQEMTARVLKKADWQVIEAANGREALERLAEEEPRLILLDLMMPVMDGFDFLLEMRANPNWRDIPVIVVTAKDLTEEDRRVLSGRVEQIVEKGACSHEDLLKLVRSLTA